jgi:lysophospholipase L1-like esterase
MKHTNDHRPKKPFAAFCHDVKHHPERPIILSEGDSWFSYPRRKSIVDHIQKMGRFDLYRLAKPGDEIVEIMSGKQKRILRRLLIKFPIDLILFSGGGNDITSEDLVSLLKDRSKTNSWEDAINKERFYRRLQHIKDAYLDLIDLRDDHRETCTIMTHGYDYPIPSDVGARLFGYKVSGPWMKPYMEQKNITSKIEQKHIAKWLIQHFDEMLMDIESKTKNFIYIKTPGTLNAEDWGDELHPTSAGFKKIADKFKPELKRLFPDTSIR